jgi:protein-disulfide isomerase
MASNMPLTPGTGAQPKTKRYLPLMIIGAVLIAALVVMWILLRSSQPGTLTNASTPGTEAAAPGAEPPQVRGNANAPVTLEEFADFQCPSCGAYYPELKKIESEFGERLRVIFRERPLVPPHEHALIAAQAAEAAGLQGRFWEMHDKLYENQKTWSEAKDLVPLFVDYAKQIGVDTDRFMKDLNGEVVATRIFQDGKRAHALNVTGTPTFFVNGKEAKDEQWKPEGLRAMINQALKEAGK